MAGRAQMVSRNGHWFTSFNDLANDIAAAIRERQTVLDGQGKLSLRKRN